MRKQCRRKVYDLVNPIQHAIEGAAITSDAKLNQLRIAEQGAIQAFCNGDATVRQWRDLVDMLNLAEHMASRGVGPEVAPVCKEAHGHLIDAARRYVKIKRMGMTGPGLQCMRDLAEYHQLQRTSISRSQYERFIKQTTDRIRSKAPEVTDVLEALEA